MRVIAVMLIGRNSFIRIEIENHDDTMQEIQRDAEELARRLDADFLYFEDVPG